jgi:hypothetical protein
MPRDSLSLAAVLAFFLAECGSYQLPCPSLLLHSYMKHLYSLSLGHVLVCFFLEPDSYLLPYFSLLLHIVLLAVEVVRTQYRQIGNAEEILGIASEEI